MKTNKYINILIFIMLTAFLTSCNDNSEVVEGKNTGKSEISQNVTSEASIEVQDIEHADFKERKIELNLSESETIKINLDSENTIISDENTKQDWQIITISKSWNYEFSWKLSNWQIVVDSDSDKDVQIILNNVEISNDFWPAILVEEASQTVINLADNSTNKVSDWKEYSSDDEDLNSTIFSKDDLIINWNWSIEVTWNYADWITSKDKLFIDSGNIKVVAADDWIKWKDYILINSWNIDITAETDWLKANNEEKATILINDWNINIAAWDDAIHSEIHLVFNGWDINITKSYEWIEAKTIVFNGWDINVVATDDWINSRNPAVESPNAWKTEWAENQMWEKGMWERNMWGPEELLAELWIDFETFKSIMDKQRSWTKLTSKEQEIFEKMEANKPAGQEKMRGQRGGWNGGWGNGGWWKGWAPVDVIDGSYIYINGWNITLNSTSDGLDSNWDILMTGWKITIYGPEVDREGSIDYNWDFKITWWEILAIWSSWMAQTPSESVDINIVNISLDSQYNSWESVILKDSNNTEVINFSSLKKFQSIVFSSKEIKTWETYILEISWEKIEEFTITEDLTKIWDFSNVRGPHESIRL